MFYDPSTTPCDPHDPLAQGLGVATPKPPRIDAYGLIDCNSVLYGLPSSTLQPLSSVLHTAAPLIKDLSPRDHITPTLKQLHWLPIHARIAFKISILVYHIHSRTSPSTCHPWLRHVLLPGPEDCDHSRVEILQ